MQNLTRNLAVCLIAAGLLFSGCDIWIFKTKEHSSSNAPATITFVGSPLLDDSMNLSMTLIPVDSSNAFILLTGANVYFHVDSIKSALPGSSYTLHTSQVFTNIPIGNKPIASQMIFDGSGSMSTSDPASLRKPAGKDYIRILADNNIHNKVALAEFGNLDSAVYNFYFNLWRNFTIATDTASLYPCIDSLSTSGTTPLYTSIRRGLEHTDSVVSASVYARSLIVFTDGEDNASLSSDSLNSVIAMAQAKKIPISAIGLGNTTAYNDLRKLSRTSGGIFAPVDSASTLSSVFIAMATGITTGFSTVIAQFNHAPAPGDIVYISVTIQSGGQSLSKSFILTIPGGLDKRRSSHYFESNSFKK